MKLRQAAQELSEINQELSTLEYIKTEIQDMPDVPDKITQGIISKINDLIVDPLKDRQIELEEIEVEDG